MDSETLQEALLDLASEAGLEVRAARSEGDFSSPTASGICRVRDAIWVVLSVADPLEVQIDVLAEALRSHASSLLEGRYLIPAVRDRLFPDSTGSDAPRE